MKVPDVYRVFQYVHVLDAGRQFVNHALAVPRLVGIIEGSPVWVASLECWDLGKPLLHSFRGDLSGGMPLKAAQVLITALAQVNCWRFVSALLEIQTVLRIYE